MISLISWRNVWRNKVRSFVVIISIALGLWAGIFIMAFSWGLYEKHIDKAIHSQISHIQLHNKNFSEEQSIEYFISDIDEKTKKIKEVNNVKGVTARTIVSGMASSTNAGINVQINGIEPDEENEVTELKRRVIEGAYFEGIKRNPVLIGQKLAEKLKINLRNKIVLTFQNTDNEIMAGAFRVVGVYKSSNSSFDARNIYVRRTDVNRLLNFDNKAHEIAVLLENNNSLEQAKIDIAKQFPDLLTQTWRELSPELRMMVDSFGQYMYIFITIILLALAFGIINTMLMAVLERTRELGMLMAIGMNKRKLFLMILLETIYLALIGGPFGVFIAWLSIQYLGNVGIDLSIVSKGLEAYGFDTIIYPDLDYQSYFKIAGMAVGTSILAAIYPARKALSLNPSEAIRKI